MKVFLLPWMVLPGMSLLLLAVGLYFFVRHKAKKGGFLILAALLIGWVGSTQAFGRLLSLTLISQISGPTLENAEEADLIVALTGGMFYGGKIGWLPKTESYRRAVVAYEVQNHVGSRVPVLFSGGHTAGLKYPSEAQVIRNYFDRRNAQVTPTLLEEASTNTYESSLQVAALAQKRNAQVMILVTSDMHMLRSLASYRARGIDAIPFPVMTLPRGNLGIYGYLPTWQGATLTSKALYEIYGIIGYLAGGKIGWSDLFYEQEKGTV
ncbi:MAG: YdcF family protein, partial [Alphaproteobacteria bacterium]|nr:YdcF family protein [Alphaproteobacteria bacterium]